MNLSRRLRRVIILTLAGIAALFLLWPHERPVAPRWEVRVRTSDGKPAVGVWVWEFSQDYSAELDGLLVDKRTDDTGLVVFNPRMLHVSHLSLALHVVFAVARSGFHAGFGPQCYGGIVRAPLSNLPIFPTNIDQHGVAHTDARI